MTELKSEQSCARTYVKSFAPLRQIFDGFIVNKTLDLVDNFVWFAEVNTASPLIVAFWSQAIVELADVVCIWVGVGELGDSVVTISGD